MSIGQTSYSVAHGKAFAGMKADNGPNDVISKVNVDVVSIPFGKFVCAKGSGDDSGAILPAATTAKLVLGVVLHAHNYAPAWTSAAGTFGELDATGLVPGAMMNVMRKGRVWIVSETAAEVGDPVFVRADVGEAGETFGSVANAADESDMIDLTAKASYVTSCSIGGLAQIEVDMTA